MESSIPLGPSLWQVGTCSKKRGEQNNARESEIDCFEAILVWGSVRGAGGYVSLKRAVHCIILMYEDLIPLNSHSTPIPHSSRSFSHAHDPIPTITPGKEERGGVSFKPHTEERRGSNVDPRGGIAIKPAGVSSLAAL